MPVAAQSLFIRLIPEACGAQLSVDARPHQDEWELTQQGGTEGEPQTLQNKIT